jgi:ATPase family AAA domain-containing protein 1
MYYIAKSVVASLPLGTDPEKEQHEQARVKATANLRRLDRLKDDIDSGEDSGRGTDNSRRPRKEDFDLDQYESQIAMEVVAPEDIPVGFDGLFPRDFANFLTNICRYWWS